MKSDHLLSRELGLSPTTIADHLGHLIAAGLVKLDTMQDERGPRHRRRRVFVCSVGAWSRWSALPKNPQSEGTAVIEARRVAIDDDTAAALARAMAGRRFGPGAKVSPRPLRCLIAPPVMSLTGSSVLLSHQPTRGR